MRRNKRISSRKYAVALLLALFIAVGATVRKLFAMAADPTEEKDCGTVGAGDDATAAKIALTAGELPLPWSQKGGTLNDASCLSRTEVFGVVNVTKEQDIIDALSAAKENKLKLSIAGVRHSMGRQAFAPHAIVLDMTGFKNVTLNEEAKTITAQAGATWHDIQTFLHPAYAVKAMQSTDIFTVGGSISVNAHGMDHNAGSVGRTIRSMRVLLPDGTIKTLSRTQEPELFHRVIGGYGLFGVILDAEIEIVDNVIYERQRETIDYRDFPAVFEQRIKLDPDYGLMYGHLSTSPGSFLKEMILFTYKDAHTDAEPAPLADVESVAMRRLVLNLSKHGSIFKRLKWFAEKHVEPMLETCAVSRANAMGEGEACLVSRNEPMHDSVTYLKNALPRETDILQEYFIPRDRYAEYIDDLRVILKENDANLLNASVRIVHKEDNVLTYAPTDMYAIVLYLNQSTDARGNARMATLTGELIDLTTAHGGRFFLPYQTLYTPAQLERSYPEIATFFAAKRSIDPEEILTSGFYEKYKDSVTAVEVGTEED